MRSKDYYEMLGIRKDATQKDIEDAYKKRAKKWSPFFGEVTEAYYVLSDPEIRAIYDKLGRAGVDPIDLEVRNKTYSAIMKHERSIAPTRGPAFLAFAAFGGYLTNLSISVASQPDISSEASLAFYGMAAIEGLITLGAAAFGIMSVKKHYFRN